MKRLDDKAFSAVEGLLILVIVGIIGGVGYYVYQARTKNVTENTSAVATESNDTTASTTADPNAGYLVVNEWGLHFKAPSGITDIKYVIHDSTLAFYAKPVNSSVQYRSDYDKLENGNYQYALGVLYRSTDSTKENAGRTVQGKKLGDYYYYTSWAFSGLATGAACVELYGDSSDSNCQAENAVFKLINEGDTALLNTIGLAQ